jgi:hypothetical protein
MIPIDTLRKIAEGLLAKSRANEVVWRSAPFSDPQKPSLSVFRPEYILALPGSQVRLNYYSNSTLPDSAVMRVSNTKGEEVGRWTIGEGEEDWEVLSNLYGEADRSVVGWGTIVDDILRAVDREGSIGRS